MDFAELFSSYLDRQGYSTQTLAGLSGVPQETIKNWQKGKVKTPQRWQTILAVAKNLRLTVVEIDQLLSIANYPNLNDLYESSDVSESHLFEPWIREIQSAEEIISSVELNSTQTISNQLGGLAEVPTPKEQIITIGGFTITISEDENSIMIQGKDDVSITLDDEELSVTIDSNTSVNLSSEGSIQLNASFVKISGSTLVSLESPLIKLN